MNTEEPARMEEDVEVWKVLDELKRITAQLERALDSVAPRGEQHE